MKYCPLRRPRFHRHDNFYLIYMDLKSFRWYKACRNVSSNLVSEIIYIFMYSETLFVSISNLFLRKFIFIWAIIILLEWCFCILNKKSVKFSHFFEIILYSTVIFAFVFYICILFCRKIWHHHWIYRGGKRKIFLAFYSFLIQVVR